jgi:hypothetical protein
MYLKRDVCIVNGKQLSLSVSTVYRIFIELWGKERKKERKKEREVYIQVERKLGLLSDTKLYLSSMNFFLIMWLTDTASMYCVIFVSRSRLQYSQRGGYPSTLAS